MKLNKLIFTLGILPSLCGNVFAGIDYAQTIKQYTPTKSFLTAMPFPKTSADTSFVERMENKAIGYRPYFNRSAFANLTIEEQDELENMAYNAEIERLNALNTMTPEKYCENYPADTEHCPGATPTQNQTPGNNPVYTVNIPDGAAGSGLYMTMYMTPENIKKYNLKTHNGGCTPPEKDNHWSNKIMTSGRYASIDSAFEKFMITSFRKEGRCGNHPADHGGYTCYGCASKGLCRGIDMETVTRPLVEDLYYNKWYTVYKINLLPDAFRGYVMWGMSGSGPVTGIKQFQGVLGVPLSGKIDDATVHAAETYRGDFADAYTRAREQFYRNIATRDPTQQVFLNGWLNGLQLLRPSGCHVVPTNPIFR